MFTPEEILNLELGQAIVRVGGSSTAFNLTTYPEPPLPEVDPTDQIIARCRKRYARPRSEVEKEIGDFGDVAERLERAAPHSEEPPDLADDDLVR